MSLLVLLVIITVVSLLLVWVKPQNLVYDKDLIFKERERKENYGTSDGQKAEPLKKVEPYEQ